MSTVQRTPSLQSLSCAQAVSAPRLTEAAPSPCWQAPAASRRQIAMLRALASCHRRALIILTSCFVSRGWRGRATRSPRAFYPSSATAGKSNQRAGSGNPGAPMWSMSDGRGATRSGNDRPGAPGELRGESHDVAPGLLLAADLAAPERSAIGGRSTGQKHVAGRAPRLENAGVHATNGGAVGLRAVARVRARPADRLPPIAAWPAAPPAPVCPAPPVAPPAPAAPLVPLASPAPPLPPRPWRWRDRRRRRGPEPTTSRMPRTR